MVAQPHCESLGEVEVGLDDGSEVAFRVGPEEVGLDEGAGGLQ